MRFTLIILQIFLLFSCLTTVASIKSKPVQISCPNFGILPLSPENIEILHSGKLYEMDGAKYYHHYDNAIDDSLLKMKVEVPSGGLFTTTKLRYPNFYSDIYYYKNGLEFVALDKDNLIEKQYISNALDIDDWEKLQYFKFVYYKVCPNEKTIPFWDRIKVVKDDRETKTKLTALVKQNGIQNLLNLIKSANDQKNKKRYAGILDEILDEKSSLYLKRNFPKYSKFADYKITWASGDNTGYNLKELFRIALNKHPHTGLIFDRNCFYIKDGSSSNEFEIHLKKMDSGEINQNGPELFFRINDGYITLSGYKIIGIRNAPNWEVSAADFLRKFRTDLSLEENQSLFYLNTELIDSLK